MLDSFILGNFLVIITGDAAALKVLISSALATVNEKYSADSAEVSCKPLEGRFVF